MVLPDQFTFGSLKTNEGVEAVLLIANTVLGVFWPGYANVDVRIKRGVVFGAAVVITVWANYDKVKSAGPEIAAVGLETLVNAAIVFIVVIGLGNALAYVKAAANGELDAASGGVRKTAGARNPFPGL